MHLIHCRTTPLAAMSEAVEESPRSFFYHSQWIANLSICVGPKVSLGRVISRVILSAKILSESRYSVSSVMSKES